MTPRPLSPGGLTQHKPAGVQGLRATGLLRDTVWPMGHRPVIPSSRALGVPGDHQEEPRPPALTVPSPPTKAHATAVYLSSAQAKGTATPNFKVKGPGSHRCARGRGLDTQANSAMMSDRSRPPALSASEGDPGQ